MFGGMEQVVEAPLTAGADDKVTIKVDCEKELELYLQTPGIHLYRREREFTDPLMCWGIL